MFFILSKIFWLFFSPDFLLVTLFVCGLVLFRLKARKTAVFLHRSVAVCLILITFLPVGKWLLFPLEIRFLPPEKLPGEIDGIVVLAGAEHLSLTQYWQQVEVGDAVERSLAFLQLARKYPAARKVFSGGSGNLNQAGLKSTDVARRLYKELGVDTRDIIFESGSRNTHENATQAKALVHPEPGEKWLLITSAYHMPRSVSIFHKAGWPVIPYPVDQKTCPDGLRSFYPNFIGNLQELNSALREWIGLLVYYFTGKTAVFLPDENTFNSL